MVELATIVLLGTFLKLDRHLVNLARSVLITIIQMSEIQVHLILRKLTLNPLKFDQLLVVATLMTDLPQLNALLVMSVPKRPQVELIALDTTIHLIKLLNVIYAQLGEIVRGTLVVFSIAPTTGRIKSSVLKIHIV